MANALNTSAPVRIPPSTYISIRVPLHAAMISGNISIYIDKKNVAITL